MKPKVMDYSKIHVLPTFYKGFEFGSFSSEKIPLPKDISPKVYLNFAVSDLAEKPTNRARVNALANSKRALHFQVDVISKALGIESLPHSQRDNFNKKLSFCKNCGVTSPTILQKLNRARNALEHEYTIPRLGQVRDFVDVVELFLAATDRIVYQFPSSMEFVYSKKTRREVPDLRDILLPPGEGTIYLHYRPGHVDELDKMDVYKWMKKYSIVLKAVDGSLYFTWVSFLLDRVYKQ